MTVGLAIILMLIVWLIYRTTVDWLRWHREQAEWDRNVKQMWERLLEADDESTRDH